MAEIIQEEKEGGKKKSENENIQELDAVEKKIS